MAARRHLSHSPRRFGSRFGAINPSARSERLRQLALEKHTGLTRSAPTMTIYNALSPGEVAADVVDSGEPNLTEIRQTTFDAFGAIESLGACRSRVACSQASGPNGMGN